jgi:adenylate cyclase
VGAKAKGEVRAALPRAGTAIAIHPIATSDPREEVQELAAALTEDVRTYLDSSSWMTARISDAPDAAAHSLRATLWARGERLRLEARLSSPDGEEIWAGKFDGALAESFDWQDEVAEEITAQCAAPLFEARKAALDARPTSELGADELLFLGFVTLYSMNRPALARAARYFAQAISVDPERPMAYSQAIRCLIHARQWGYRDIVAEHAAAFDRWRDKVRTLPSAGPLHDIILTYADYILKPEPIVLRAAVDRALRKAPFDAEVLAYAALVHLYAGEAEAALDCVRKAERYGRLSPFRVAISFTRATALIQTGRDEAALAELDRHFGDVREAPTMYRIRAAALAHLGRIDEARAAIGEVLRLVPDDTVRGLRDRNGFIDTPSNRRFLDGLRLAGLPEGGR